MNDPFQDLRPLAGTYATALAREAFSRGLVTTGPDGTPRAITPGATPVVLPARVIAERHALSHTLATAGFRMAQATVLGPSRELLLAALSPLERRLIERSAPRTHRLAIARVDFLVSTHPAALELNATIPAMPGYSDMAAGAFLSVVGRAAGMDPAAVRQLEAENGSNVEALYRALVTASVQERGRRPERIALLCRRNDSQLSEVDHLVSRFAELGTEAHRVYPDEASGGELFIAHGKTFDFVYRHLFSHRLRETPHPFLEAFFAGEAAPGSLLFNHPAAHVEAKSNFALLSRALEDPALAAHAGLGPEELEAIRRAVPWTRVLAPGPARGPGGEAIPELVAHVAARPEEFVLKRAWDYGGKAVFVGPASDEPGFATRSEAAFGERLAWSDLVRRAAADPRGGGFVVQAVVDIPKERHLLATPDGPVEAEVFVDYSAFASVGLEPEPAWGGVVRASASRIVNIQGGGGVLPLLEASVWERLRRALRAES
ncbi:MAG TPA: hypothetical protein VFD38_15580 [Myxococcaceae bacterium]|nr:hypothetical protein [Myxococcaceae bacterium]